MEKHRNEVSILVKGDHVIAISCPKCGKEYVFDETKIPNDIEMLECKICKTRFLLDREEDLFVDPLDDLPTEEEILSSRASFYSEPYTERSRHEAEPPAFSGQAPMPDDDLLDTPIEELSPPTEDVPDPDLEAVEATHPWEDRKPSLPTFCAERYRVLNAKSKKRETKIFLYGLLALISFIFLCFVIYSGR